MRHAPPTPVAPPQERIGSVFMERPRGTDDALTLAADPPAMKTHVFIDDGYPESREYNDNYHFMGDPEAERHIPGWLQVGSPYGGKGGLFDRIVAAIRSATQSFHRD